MIQKVIRYEFEYPSICEMCESDTTNHKILGQRLSCSQGFKPKSKSGISVSIKKCNSCGLIYSSPMPIPMDIQDHYGIPPEQYWKEEYFESDPDYFINEINILKKLISINNNAKALDIGAGLGKCIISLNKAGFDTYGLEPSESFYKMAISKMGIKPERIKLGMIENAEYQGNYFDFITFGAVLEHLYHPAKSIEKALKWLKPGGILHIEVPSASHLIPKFINFYYNLMGTNYVTHLSPMHEPFHLYEFTLKSFQVLATKLNFEIVLSEYQVCSIYSIPKLFHPILREYMKRTDTGMQLIVWVRKN